MTTEKALYTTAATVRGGRTGIVTSNDGRLSLNLTPPHVSGDSGVVGTNPEQLFAAGYAACFQSALAIVARRQRVDTSNSAVTGTVGLYPNGNGGYQLSAALAVTLPGVEREVGERLLEMAHQVCPYSNAIRGNIAVQISLVESVDASYI